MLLEKPYSARRVCLHKVLDVWRAFGSFLELPCYEDHTRDLRPGFEVLVSVNRWVVKRSDCHACL